MIKIATPHFDFESKKVYMKPTMKVVELRQKHQILAGSLDSNGMNQGLQSEEVDEGW